jgi:hypothetical protein
LFENNNRELEKEDARLRLTDEGWSLDELVDFAIENVANVSSTPLYTRLLNTKYPRKTLAELIELFEVIKVPFTIKYSKSEYKKLATEQDKLEYLNELRVHVLCLLRRF